MNREWMREQLTDFLALCQSYDAELSSEYTAAKARIADVMAPKIPTVREVLKRLDPQLATEVTMPMYMTGTSNSRRAIQFGLGILSDQDSWQMNLAPDAPSLVADRFHPHVWAAAAPLWGTGMYRVAVGNAAASLSAHIATKAGSHLLTDRELVTQVFATAPPSSGQVRLHLPGDTAGRTWRSRQEGLHLLAQGAFAGIRNVAAHTDEEWTEQVGLEHLAVLSVVARWADETEVVTPA